MFTLETEFKYENVQFLIGIGKVYRLNAIIDIQLLTKDIPVFPILLL